MGLYKVENIENPNIRKINKKHKAIRRDTPGMNFESYPERISSLRQIDIARSNKKLVQKRL